MIKVHESYMYVCELFNIQWTAVCLYKQGYKYSSSQKKLMFRFRSVSVQRCGRFRFVYVFIAFSHRFRFFT